MDMWKNENDLIVEIKKGNEVAYELLISKYRILLVSYLTQFKFIKVCDYDYIVFSCFTLLPNLIENYDSKKGKFYSYAIVAFKNYIAKIIKEYKNDLEHICYCIDDEGFKYNFDINPDNYLFDILKENFSIFNKLEQSILELFIEGYSYKEIAKLKNINTKKVDNTIQKLRKVIKNS